MEKTPKDYFNYKRKDIHCVYFWDNKKNGITAYDDKERYLKSFNQLLILIVK